MIEIRLYIDGDKICESSLKIDIDSKKNSLVYEGEKYPHVISYGKHYRELKKLGNEFRYYDWGYKELDSELVEVENEIIFKIENGKIKILSEHMKCDE